MTSLNTMRMRQFVASENPPLACSGFCRACREIHLLKQGNAREYCLELMQTLEEKGRIDFDQPTGHVDQRFSTAFLFAESRGQMFGTLECLAPSGRTVILKAFSGQYNGVWEVAGWVPPLLDVAEFQRLVDKTDPQIKALGKRLESLPPGLEKEHLSHQRKKLSQDLMKALHALYQVHNLRGEVKPLLELFSTGIPTGAGDCCAPKLLNFAARNQLRPVSLAEFYWGRENRSGTRQHGCFYSACESKCKPILGFMLCGLGEKDET